MEYDKSVRIGWVNSYIPKCFIPAEAAWKFDCISLNMHENCGPNGTITEFPGTGIIPQGSFNAAGLYMLIFHGS